MTDVLDMAETPEERDALARLAGRLDAAQAGSLPEPPAQLRARTLAAVTASAAEPAAAAPAPRRRLIDRLRPRPLFGGIAVAAAAAAVALAIVLPGGPAGELEAQTTLASGAVSADVEIREIGIGRTVQIDSNSLPTLPKGAYYEVWFVGAGDSPSEPNRVSAGTFHPDAEGRSQVTLKAAADPSIFGRLEVTREPADGDPRASARVSLEGALSTR